MHLELKLLTGLHIGGYESTFDIGGADSSVIKNPLTMQPYIPGSSLKGKLRTLLTYRYNSPSADGIELNDSNMLNLFADVEQMSPSVTRAIFRDMFLTKESLDLLEKSLGEKVYTEIKAENKINIMKGKAEHPRFIERVPAGVSFQGEINLMVFDGDDEQSMKDTIKQALHLLELNYLGGNGSRGYGRVKIVKDEWTDELI